MSDPTSPRDFANPRVGDSAESLIEEPSVLAMLTMLLQRRRLITSLAAAGFVAGAAYGLLSTRQYVATATFMPQASADGGSAGGLALAASQFGIRVPTGGGGWSAPIYVDLLTSRGLLAPIAVDTLTVAEQGNARVPVAKLLKLDDLPPAERTEKTVAELRMHVAAAEVKKMGSVQIVARTPWPSVSLALVKRLLAEVNEFNLLTRQSQARAERVFAEAQVKEAAQLLRDAEDHMREFKQRNRVVGVDMEFDRDRLQREITMRQQAYTSLVQSYAEARLREVRDTPVITVLDAPVLPVIGESRQTALKAIMGALVGAILGILAVFMSAARGSENERLRTLFQAADEALPRFLRRR